MIERGAAGAGAPIEGVMGSALYDRLSTFGDDGGRTAGPMETPGSAAGALWNVISARFAGAARGKVRAIHAAPRDDPYFQGPHATSTWSTIEEPTVRRRSSTTVTRLFGDDLGTLLRQPRRHSFPDWSGTGGFLGNLRF